MTDLAPEPILPPKRSPGWLKPLKLLLLAVVLFFVGRVLLRQWQQLAASGVDVHVRAWPLVGTAIFLMLVAVIQAVSYRALLGAYADAPAWRAMPTIAWVPPMGKYVPGGAVIAAVAMLRRLRIPVPVAVAVVLVQDGLAQAAGLIVSAPLLWWPPVERAVPWAKIVAGPVILVAVVCLWPAVFGRLLDTLLRLIRRPPLPRRPRLRQYAIPLATAFGQWVLHGVALGLIVQGVTGDTPWPRLHLFMSFAALSQTIGYLVIFAPGGLGPREAVLLACLTPMIGPLAAVVVPIRAVAQVAVDLLMGAIGLAVAGRRSAPSPGTPGEG